MSLLAPEPKYPAQRWRGMPRISAAFVSIAASYEPERSSPRLPDEVAILTAAPAAKRDC